MTLLYHVHSDTEDTENSSDSSNDSNLSELDPYIDDEAASKIPADMSFMKDVSILVPSLVIPDFPLYKGELLPSRCTRTLKDSAHVRSALQSIKTHHNLTTSAVSTLTQFAKMIWHAAQLASDSNAPRLPLKLDSNGYRSSKSGLPTPEQSFIVCPAPSCKKTLREQEDQIQCPLCATHLLKQDGTPIETQSIIEVSAYLKLFSKSAKFMHYLMNPCPPEHGCIRGLLHNCLCTHVIEPRLRFLWLQYV